MSDGNIELVSRVAERLGKAAQRLGEAADKADGAAALVEHDPDLEGVALSRKSERDLRFTMSVSNPSDLSLPMTESLRSAQAAAAILTKVGKLPELTSELDRLQLHRQTTSLQQTLDAAHAVVNATRTTLSDIELASTQAPFGFHRTLVFSELGRTMTNEWGGKDRFWWFSRRNISDDSLPHYAGRRLMEGSTRSVESHHGVFARLKVVANDGRSLETPQAVATKAETTQGRLAAILGPVRWTRKRQLRGGSVHTIESMPSGPARIAQQPRDLAQRLQTLASDLNDGLNDEAVRASVAQLEAGRRAADESSPVAGDTAETVRLLDEVRDPAVIAHSTATAQPVIGGTAMLPAITGTGPTDIDS